MRTCLALLATATCLIAADGGASITPAPGFEPPKPGAQPMPPGRMPGMPPMGRPSMAFEVEMLLVKSGDTAAVARWAELAALGYRVVAALPGDQGITLCLERSAMGGAPGPLRLPAVLEQDASAAAALRGRIEAAQAERAKVMMPAPRPAPPVEPK